MKAIDILIKRKEQHIITSLIDDLKKNHVLISSDVSLRLVQKFNAVGLYKYTIAIIDILFNLNQRRRVIPAHIHGSIYSSLIFIAMEACAMARTPDKAIEIFSLVSPILFFQCDSPADVFTCHPPVVITSCRYPANIPSPILFDPLSPLSIEISYSLIHYGIGFI